MFFNAIIESSVCFSIRKSDFDLYTIDPLNLKKRKEITKSVVSELWFWVSRRKFLFSKTIGIFWQVRTHKITLYVRRLSRLIRSGRMSKFLSYFFHFWWFQWKFLGLIIIDRCYLDEHLEFSGIFRSYPPPEIMFRVEVEKTWFWHFRICKREVTKRGPVDRMGRNMI